MKQNPHTGVSRGRRLWTRDIVTAHDPAQPLAVMLSYRERRRIAEENAAYAKASTKTEPRPSSWSLLKQQRWGLLNQPFTLWLLSALVLSLWSTYHSAAQQCHEQAEKVYSDFISLLDEIGGRVYELRYLNYDPAKQDNPDILKIYRGEMGYQSPSYRGHTLYAVWSAYNRTASKIIAPNLPDLIGVEAEHRNYEHDLRMDLGSVSYGLTYSIFVTPDSLKDDWDKIERRRILVEGGRPAENCALGAISSIAAFGYSDEPQWIFEK
jgi:hypothetical protein